MEQQETSSLAARLAAIETTLAHIEQRNKRVEQDKAWERSAARKLSIALITYGTTALVFCSLDVTKPLLNALVPTLGYLTSTFTLPAAKRWWTQRSAP